jgi:hypothetical protein
MLNLHLVVSVSASGEIRQEYLGPDRLAAQKTYATNIPDAVQVGYFPFLQVAQLRKIKSAAVSKKK